MDYSDTLPLVKLMASTWKLLFSKFFKAYHFYQHHITDLSLLFAVLPGRENDLSLYYFKCHLIKRGSKTTGIFWYSMWSKLHVCTTNTICLPSLKKRSPHSQKKRFLHVIFLNKISREQTPELIGKNHN